MSTLLFAFAPFVLFPALVFLFAPASVRRIAMAAGLAVAIVSYWTIDGGRANPLYLLPVATAGIAGGALMIEIVAQLRRLIKGRRVANG